MSSELQMPVKNGTDASGKKIAFVEPTDDQVGKIADKAASKVEDKVKTVFGVENVTLDSIAAKLRPKVRDADIDTGVGFDRVKAQNGIIPTPVAAVHTHRYTIDVPDKGEGSVLNLGHGDARRDLDDSGITARTQSHIRLHTQNAANASVIALGGKMAAPRPGLIDPKKVLDTNTGVSIVTNDRFWTEAEDQLNLVSAKGQAALRANLGRVRIQADDANTEIASGEQVVVGGKSGVKIVANSAVSPGDNAYGTGFTEELVSSVKSEADKDATTFIDWLTSTLTTWQAYEAEDRVYDAGKLKTKVKKNDKLKIAIDTAKAFSSYYRMLDSQDADGKVSISAQTYASITGRMAASMYGRLSATVASAVSASMVSLTAGVKGLLYASVWAGKGVSIRTLTGSASLRSDKGGVGIMGADEVNVMSDKGVNIGGHQYAELKSRRGTTYVAGGKYAKICSGEDDGTGVIANPSSVHIGAVRGTNTAKALPDHMYAIQVKREGTRNILIKAGGSAIKCDDGVWLVNGKKIKVG